MVNSASVKEFPNSRDPGWYIWCTKLSRLFSFLNRKTTASRSLVVARSLPIFMDLLTTLGIYPLSLGDADSGATLASWITANQPISCVHLLTFIGRAFLLSRS